MKSYKRVLSIAGSDPSGGAGIQADLKSISACGCFATTAITAIVDENTIGVYGVHPIPNSFISGQIHSVLDDIGADSIKIGMLHSSELIMTVKECLLKYNINNVVLDPVMVATSGDSLLQPEAISTLKNELISICRIITPNIPEAEILSETSIKSIDDMRKIASALGAEYKTSVLLKGGHLTDQNIVDVLYNNETSEIIEFTSAYIKTKNKHGTGCSLSSAIASFLAYGYELNKAISLAKNYINNAIEAGSKYKIGKGNGPVHHFHEFWE